MTEERSVRVVQDGQAWFVRLYAIAVIAHIAGNRPLGLDLRGVTTLILGLAAAVLVVRAHRTPLIAAVAGLVIATAWMQAPVLGNHWLVMAVVSIALLVALTRRDWWAWFAPTGRWILLVFYAFAAFAKLNSAFFDPSVSCSVFYANQALESWSLPTIAWGSGLGFGAAVATAVIELSVPVLLLVRRTRHLGVALGYVFHFIISLDLHQHFYDFTAVLFALFALFLGDEARRHLERTASGFIMRYGRVLVAAMAIPVVASVVPLSHLSAWILLDGVFFLWIPAALALVALTLHSLRRSMEVRLRPPDPVSVLVVAFVLVNALTPYLEVKSAFGFTMYSNLAIADGETNHLIVPASLPLTDGNGDLIVITATTSATFSEYINSGWATPLARVRHLLADEPEASVTYVRLDDPNAQPTTITGAEGGRRLPLIEEKWLPFRSVSTESPRPCQTLWLPSL